jgi:RimJ/RimL family protein N-acetyltransferase
MTDAYIDAHFDDIRDHGSDIENRLDDSGCTAENLKEDNRKIIEGFSKAGEQIILIDTDYESTLSGLFEGNKKMHRTERLILRCWEDSDAEDLYQYASDPDVGPIAGWPPHQSVDESRDVIKNVFNGKEAYAICLKEDGKAIGSIGLMVGEHSNIGLPDNEAEIGYWIGVPFWGQGLIPEGVREIIRHAFEELHVETLWCGYFEGNDKSRRVQEKCGFTYRYTKENMPCAIDGLLRTEHFTRITKEEWKARGR